jgi:hypothetical protein
MPRKIKIINESIEKSPPSSPKPLEDIPLEEPEVEVVKVVKEKKPRSEKQILAFEKALQKRKEKLELKKQTEIPKEIVVEVEESKEVEMKELKKRGRPKLTEEKIEMKATLKELELQKQLDKLQKKLELSAKKEAKKQVLEKIKSKLNTDEESVSSISDDEEITNILKKQKKPIVIVNKIDTKPLKKQLPPQNISGAYFV